MSKRADPFLSEQIITYIGNKRGLLDQIEERILCVCRSLGSDKLDCADLFSGSGIAARLMKSYASCLTANDIEHYSTILNSCYLTNRSEFDDAAYDLWRARVDKCAAEHIVKGPVSKYYAPENDSDIRPGERVFYTAENAAIIDSLRAAIEEVPEAMKKYFLAPLLYEASVHVNTSGVFKGFYKDTKTGIGKFGGEGGNALSRIMGRIELKKPVLSTAECRVDVRCSDANRLAAEMAAEGTKDLIYIDPPYNQHPYGSNYFMLNVIAENREPEKASRVSGIPENWKRSKYNSSRLAHGAFAELLECADAKYLLVSYNSEGYISFGEMEEMLSAYGDVDCKKIKYNTFRGSRNLGDRDIYVTEYIFTVKKR
ncbi:MAG: DNA adenine methylase [Eubacteriaceae bacterium]|nr:DNA adenine methylase [Eubacteriaceae bacterium]